MRFPGIGKDTGKGKRALLRLIFPYGSDLLISGISDVG